MDVAFIGLGKMGLNLALQAARKGHQVRTFDIAQESRLRAAGMGLTTTDQLEDVFRNWPGRKLVWLMVPAGKPVDDLLDQMIPLLEAGDVVIDGGNSYYRDSQCREARCVRYGIGYLDCGTSGGVSGALQGVCAMVGGRPEYFAYALPLLTDISLPGGLLHCGEPGSGHYVKMVHNGIEYGMMQALAEGFDMLEKSGMQLDQAAISSLWEHGSVIRGWLLELTTRILKDPDALRDISSVVNASGEAEWMVRDAMEKRVAVPVTSAALMMRYRSQETDSYQGKVLAMLRNAFGGHAVQKQES